MASLPPVFREYSPTIAATRAPAVAQGWQPWRRTAAAKSPGVKMPSCETRSRSSVPSQCSSRALLGHRGNSAAYSPRTQYSRPSDTRGESRLLGRQGPESVIARRPHA